MFVLIGFIIAATIALYLTKSSWEDSPQQKNLKKGNADNHFQHEYRRLDDLLNYLRSVSEDATVTDRKFRSVFDRETVDLNSSLDDLMEKPKRRLMISDDGEIDEREYRERHD